MYHHKIASLRPIYLAIVIVSSHCNQALGMKNEELGWISWNQTDNYLIYNA